jgi:hypothetical protein
MKLLKAILRKLAGQPRYPTAEEAALLNAQALRSI